MTKEEKIGIEKWTKIADSESWLNIETRLKIRDVCNVGKEKHRYTDPLLSVIYPVDRPAFQTLTTLHTEYCSQKLKNT